MGPGSCQLAGRLGLHFTGVSQSLVTLVMWSLAPHHCPPPLLEKPLLPQPSRSHCSSPGCSSWKPESHPGLAPPSPFLISWQVTKIPFPNHALNQVIPVHLHSHRHRYLPGNSFLVDVSQFLAPRPVLSTSCPLPFKSVLCILSTPRLKRALRIKLAILTRTWPLFTLRRPA